MELTETSTSAASSVQEARKKKSKALTLYRITELPQDVRTLDSITILDVCNNKISRINEDSLPSQLTELRITGCGLETLPLSLKSLPNLEKLFAGANKLVDVDVVFLCAKLQHAGLGFNRIAEIVLPSSLCCPSLISLDVSFNELIDLQKTLIDLQELPQLLSVNLKGNPFCLQQIYRSSVQSSLPQLRYLDEKRFDAGSAVPVPSTGSKSTTSTYLQIHMAELNVIEDYFQATRIKWEQQFSEAQAMGEPVTYDIPKPPLQPVYYHYEFTDHEGVQYASIPFCVQPPQPPEAEILDPKARAKKAAEDAKKTAAKVAPVVKGKPGAPVAKEEVIEEVPKGSLKVVIPLPADVAARDWLRSGLTVKAYRTVLVAVPIVEEEGEKQAHVVAPTPPPVAPAKPTTPLSRNGTPVKGKKKGSEIEIPEERYSITFTQSLVASGVAKCTGNLLDGCTASASEPLSLVYESRLWDDKGIRLPLKGPQQPTDALATLSFQMQLHVAVK